MNIKNYLPALARNNNNLFLVTNDKIMDLIRSAYKDIKAMKRLGTFIKLTDLKKSTITGILRGETLPSLNFIDKLNKGITWNIWELIYKEAEFLRGKTNSNVIKFPKILSDDLAYLFGALRDGSLVHYSYVYEIEYAQKHPAWLEKILAPKIERCFGIKVTVKQRKNKSFVIRIRSTAMFAIIKYITQHQANYQSTPEIILKSPFELQKHYIAGFYDAEGRKNLNDLNIYQQWYNKTCPPLEDIKKILERRNINSKFRIKPQNNAFLFTLHIEGKSRRRFLENIPIQHPTIKKLF